MSELLRESEDVPAAYPPEPMDITTVGAAVIWQRIESWVFPRWTPRTVVWTVQGPGDWEPPLTPAAVSEVACWSGLTWQTATLDPSPLGGYHLPGSGPYRVTASVGGGTVPHAVNEAFRRLAKYLADDEVGVAGASEFSTLVGPIELSYDRAPTWQARAMQNSGAADLLRPYRRLK